jgi:chromosome segregation ATPase
MKLLSVSISNFKSFNGPAVVVPFDSGFNCVTGPNGSGKSNVLDAICFCLGESNSRLRVSRTAELLSNVAGIQQQPDAVVELTIRDDRGALVTLKAKANLQGQKSYEKNGRATTLKDVRRMLLCECNLAVDSPSWLIYQNAVQQFICKDGAFLVDALCAASGTKLFHNFKTEAERKMKKFAVNQEEVRANVNMLRARMQKEIKHFEEVEKLQGVERSIAQMELTEKKLIARKLRADLARLDADGAAASKQEQQLKNKLEQQRGKVATAKKQLSSLAGEEGSQELAAKERALSEAQERLSAADMQLELEVAEAAEMTTKRAEMERSLREKTTELQRTKALISRVEGRVIPALLADINDTEAQHERVQLETDSAELLRDARSTLHTMESMLSTDKERAMLSRGSKAHAESEHEAALSCVASVKAHLQQLKAKQLRLCESESANNTSSAISNRGYDYHEATQAQLEKLLDAARKKELHLQHAAKERATKLARFHHRSSCKGLRGDHGTLFSVIQIRKEVAAEASTAAQYLDGLEIILGGRLGVRVCDSNLTAKALLREASKGGGRAMTLWALERVLTADTQFKPSVGQKLMVRIRQRFGDSAVVDPHSLLCVGEGEVAAEPRLESVLYKAVGSWMLSETDDVARALLQEFHVPSVCWTTGNQHVRGALIGGHRQSKGAASSSPMRLKYEEAVQGLQRVECARTRRECTSRISLLEEVVSTGTKLSNAESQLRLLCSRAEECRKKLEQATLGDEHAQYALSSCEAKLDRARAQEHALEQQQEEGGIHTDRLMAEMQQLLSKDRHQLSATQQTLDSARDRATLCILEMTELEEGLHELPTTCSLQDGTRSTGYTQPDTTSTVTGAAAGATSSSSKEQEQRQEQEHRHTKRHEYHCECEKLQREVKRLREVEELEQQQTYQFEEQVLQQETLSAELMQKLVGVQQKLKRLKTACTSARSAANAAVTAAGEECEMEVVGGEGTKPGERREQEKASAAEGEVVKSGSRRGQEKDFKLERKCS